MIFKNIKKVDKSYSEILHPGHVRECQSHRYLEFNSKKEMKDFVNCKEDRIVIADEFDTEITNNLPWIDLQNIKLKRNYYKVKILFKPLNGSHLQINIMLL